MAEHKLPILSRRYTNIHDFKTREKGDVFSSTLDMKKTENLLIQIGSIYKKYFHDFEQFRAYIGY